MEILINYVWILYAAAAMWTLMLLGMFVTSIIALNRIQELHLLINSRLSQLLKTTGDARFSEGREFERTDHAR